MPTPPERPVILVVDDDPATARLMELALRTTRAQVVTHYRAFGLLEAIAAHKPALVVLDVMMPGLDGPSLVQLVRADPELARTRIVLWSGSIRATSPAARSPAAPTPASRRSSARARPSTGSASGSARGTRSSCAERCREARSSPRRSTCAAGLQDLDEALAHEPADQHELAGVVELPR